MTMSVHKPQSIVHQLSRTPRAVSNGVRRCNSSLRRLSSRISSSNPSWLTTTTDDDSQHDSMTNCMVYIDKALEVSSRTDTTQCSSSISRSGSADFAPIKPMRRPSSDPSLSNVINMDIEESCKRNAVFAPVDAIPAKPVRYGSKAMNRDNDDEDSPKILPLHTINQNDFMIQCLLDTSRPCLVHFYAEDSVVSDTLDRELGALHAQSFRESGSSSGCRFMRMSASAAPFITSKLQVSAQDPSIVCLHNGQVFERMIDPECYIQFPGAVQQWARNTGLLDP